MTSDHLPAVLVPKKPNNAISMERALKNIKEHLEECFYHYSRMEIKELRESKQDACQAAIDDVEVMLENLK